MNRQSPFFVLAVLLLLLFQTGCSSQSNYFNTENSDSQSSVETAVELLCQVSEIHNMPVLREDFWGLGDINEIFELWGWYPSTDPTNIEEISKETGMSISEIEDQKESLKRILLSIPKMQEDDSETLFLTDIVEQQFVSAEWEKYTFDECELLVIAGNSDGFCGRAYLRNGNKVWRSSKPAIFLAFKYVFEQQRVQIIEMIETASGVVDYKMNFEYENDETALQLHEAEGIRILDVSLELNQVDEFVPVAELKDDELKRYVEMIFLDLCRCHDNLYKYKGVFPEDTISLLETVEYYYDKPKEIYDFAETRLYTETTGTVTLGSQFQTSFWETIMVEMDFDFEYEKMTGKIVVHGGDMRIVEKN